MLLNSLTNVINEPTRLNALLDPIVLKEDLNFLDPGTFTVPDHISDHLATFSNITFSIGTEKSFPTHRLVIIVTVPGILSLVEVQRHSQKTCKESTS